MVITVDGIGGALDVPNTAAGAQLALDLLFAGYIVRANALKVAIYHGPGYDMLIWAEGDFDGQPVVK